MSICDLEMSCDCLIDRVREALADERLYDVGFGTDLEGPWTTSHHFRQLRAEAGTVMRPVRTARNLECGDVSAQCLISVIRGLMVVAEFFERTQALILARGKINRLFVKLHRFRDGKAPAGLHTSRGEVLERLEPDRLAFVSGPGQVRVVAGHRRSIVVRHQLFELVCTVACDFFYPSADLGVGPGAPRL